MNVTEAIYQRQSIRQFQSKPIAPAIINELLEVALQSPSWSNTQPYKVAVATGPVLEQLKAELVAKFERAAEVQQKGPIGKLLSVLTNDVRPDGDFNTLLPYPKELQKRRVETGKGLYKTLDIARDDLDGRHAQFRKNFEFFGAPTAIFVFVHGGLKEFSVLDAGIFTQTLALAAVEKGLGTCILGSAAMWRSPIEKHFKIPENYKLICGVSLGYVENCLVNTFKPGRMGLEELLIPHA